MATVEGWAQAERLYPGVGLRVTELRQAYARGLDDSKLSGQPLDPPSWDDRKELLDLWQNHAPLPDVELRAGGVYDALLAVARWGYQRSLDQ